MKIFKYRYSLNPDIADSELVEKVQKTLKTKARFSSVQNNYNTASMQEYATKNNYVNEIKSFTIEYDKIFSSTDIISFKRVKDETSNTFEVDINREVRFTSKYIRDMASILGAKQCTFSEEDIPEADNHIFEKYLSSDAKK